MELKDKKCIPCEGGVRPFDRLLIDEHIKHVKGWSVGDNDKCLKKTLYFVDFKRALSFVNEIGDLAEFEGHHPDINLHNWNQVTITLSTHAIKGLSENDFIMAAKIDQILKDSEDGK